MNIKIQIFSIPGCEATLPTIELVNTVAREMKVWVTPEHHLIAEVEQAIQEYFIGSPTVRINGLDIEVAARGALSFGIT